MDEKKLKTVIGLVYGALMVVALILVIDLQIKNSILRQAEDARKELDKLRDELGAQNGIILEAATGRRVDYFPADLRSYGRGDDSGMAMADMVGETPTEGGTVEGVILNETISYSGDGDSELPADD